MNNNRADSAIIIASAVVAVLAILADVVAIGQPIQFVATLGGILLGPGSLGCRLASSSKWSECLMVGVAINIAALMLLALTAVALHFWQPKIELIIPAATCVLAIVLYRKGEVNDHRDSDYKR
jgi:hypothetical protein